MPDETLLTASRRLMRFLSIDEAHGGFLTTETLIARDTLAKQIHLEAEREKAAELATAPKPGDTGRG